MALGHDETWMVMMGSDECTGQRWVEAALNWVDFDLNASSECSEERSDADSEEFPQCENEEPCVTIPIGCDLNGDAVEEEMESEGDEADVDEILVMQEGEIKERGNHDELITRNGIYKKLIDMQSFQ